MRRHPLLKSLGTLAAASLLGTIATGHAAAQPTRPLPPAATVASTTPTDGYLLVGADGSAYPFGTQSYGSVYSDGITGLYGSHPLAAPIVGGAPTPDGKGYWLVAKDGGVFNFGDAGFYGNTYTLGLTGLGGSHPLAAPVVGMAATPDGRGYWLVAADGGVFTFGDAGFYGNTYTLGLTGLGGSHPLAAPVVGIVPTPDGKGYWLVAADGGIFSFGDAGFYGNTYTLGLTGLGGSHPLAAPVVGMAATPDGRGYWLVAADGGIFSFGDAGFYGNTYTLGLTGLGGSHPLAAPVVGIVPTPDGQGYDLIAADGGVFNFGDAPFEGSTYGYGYSGLGGSQPLPGRVVAGFLLPFSGFDVSNFNCSNLPYMPPNEQLLSVETNGWPFSWDYSSGSCFTQAVGLGGTNTQLWLFGGSRASSGVPEVPPPASGPWDTWNGNAYTVPASALATPAGQLYEQLTHNTAPSVNSNFAWGYGQAQYAYATAIAYLGASSPVLANTWWLDVETGANTWSSSTASANTSTIYGALAFFESLGVPAGVYSNSYQWDLITANGGAPGPTWGAALPPATPLWVPAPGMDPTQVCSGANTGPSWSGVPSYAAFGGGVITKVQYGLTLAFNAPTSASPQAVDLDAACPPA